MDKVRFAVAGTGSIIREFHLRVLAQNPRADVLAAANLHSESLEALADDFKITTTYTDFDQLAEDPRIDAVVIGLPNYLNAPVTIQMLRAGKHVLCEKPMARTVEEAESTVQAAESSGKTLMIAHVWRSNNDMRWLREVVNSGKLGFVFKCKAHAVPLFWGPPAGSWRVQAALSGGGAFADIGIHSVDTLAFLFGDEIRPVKVFALQGNHFQKLEVEDTANVLIEYENGMAGWIEAGWYHNFANSPHGAIELFGTKGYARVFPTELHCEVQGAWDKSQPSWPAPKTHIDIAMYAAQMDHFIDCILNGCAPLCDGRKGLQAVRVMRAVYESARAGRAVTL
jgi:predicted dehydrogenase